MAEKKNLTVSIVFQTHGKHAVQQSQVALGTIKKEVDRASKSFTTLGASGNKVLDGLTTKVNLLNQRVNVLVASLGKLKMPVGAVGAVAGSTGVGVARASKSAPAPAVVTKQGGSAGFNYTPSRTGLLGGGRFYDENQLIKKVWDVNKAHFTSLYKAKSSQWSSVNVTRDNSNKVIKEKVVLDKLGDLRKEFSKAGTTLSTTLARATTGLEKAKAYDQAAMRMNPLLAHYRSPHLQSMIRQKQGLYEAKSLGIQDRLRLSDQKAALRGDTGSRLEFGWFLQFAVFGIVNSVIRSIQMAFQSVLNYSLRALEAVKGISATFLNVNEQFATTAMMFESVYGSKEMSNEMTAQIGAVAGRSFIPTEQLLQLYRSASVIPVFQNSFRKEYKEGTLGSEGGSFDGLRTLVEQMVAFRPDKTTTDAIFSLRELLAGNKISLQRRFDLSLRTIGSATGYTPSEITGSPDVAYKALTTYFSSIIDPDTIKGMTRQPSKLYDNLMDQFTSIGMVTLGRSGKGDGGEALYATILSVLQRGFDSVAAFFSLSGGSFTEVVAEKMGDSIKRLFSTAVGGSTKLYDKILSSLGFSKERTGYSSLIERTADALQSFLEYLEGGLPSFIERFISVVDPLLGLLEKVMFFVKSIVDSAAPLMRMLGSTGTLAALLTAPALPMIMASAMGAKTRSVLGETMFGGSQITGSGLSSSNLPSQSFVARRGAEYRLIASAIGSMVSSGSIFAPQAWFNAKGNALTKSAPPMLGGAGLISTSSPLQKEYSQMAYQMFSKTGTFYKGLEQMQTAYKTWAVRFASLFSTNFFSARGNYTPSTVNKWLSAFGVKMGKGNNMLTEFGQSMKDLHDRGQLGRGQIGNYLRRDLAPRMGGAALAAGGAIGGAAVGAASVAATGMVALGATLVTVISSLVLLEVAIRTITFSFNYLKDTIDVVRGRTLEDNRKQVSKGKTAWGETLISQSQRSADDLLTDYNLRRLSEAESNKLVSLSKEAKSHQTSTFQWVKQLFTSVVTNRMGGGINLFPSSKGFGFTGEQTTLGDAYKRFREVSEKLAAPEELSPNELSRLTDQYKYLLDVIKANTSNWSKTTPLIEEELSRVRNFLKSVGHEVSSISESNVDGYYTALDRVTSSVSKITESLTNSPSSEVVEGLLGKFGKSKEDLETLAEGISGIVNSTGEGLGEISAILSLKGENPRVMLEEVQNKALEQLEESLKTLKGTDAEGSESVRRLKALAASGMEGDRMRAEAVASSLRAQAAKTPESVLKSADAIWENITSQMTMLVKTHAEGRNKLLALQTKVAAEKFGVSEERLRKLIESGDVSAMVDFTEEMRAKFTLPLVSAFEDVIKQFEYLKNALSGFGLPELGLDSLISNMKESLGIVPKVSEVQKEDASYAITTAMGGGKGGSGKSKADEAFADVFKWFSDLESMTNEQFAPMLKRILGGALNDVAKELNLPSDVTKKWMESLVGGTNNQTLEAQKRILTDIRNEAMEMANGLDVGSDAFAKLADRAYQAQQGLNRIKQEMLSNDPFHKSIKDMGESFKNALGTNIADFVTGVKSAGEAFRDFANTFINEVVRIMINNLVQSFFGSVGNTGGGGLFGVLLGGFGGSRGGLVSSNGIGSPHIVKMARGGYIGAGSGIRDDVPAMLKKGEYVLSPSAVKDIGVSQLNSMNRGDAKYFAGGGYVGNAPSGGSSGASLNNNVNVTVNVQGKMDEEQAQGVGRGIGAGLREELIRMMDSRIVNARRAGNAMA